MPDASEVRNPPFLPEAKPTAREAHFGRLVHVLSHIVAARSTTCGSYGKTHI